MQRCLVPEAGSDGGHSLRRGFSPNPSEPPACGRQARSGCKLQLGCVDPPGTARLLVACGLLLAWLLPAVPPAAAEGVSATVQEILDRPETYIDNRQARVKDVASEPQQIRTAISRAQLKFGNGATARVPQNSLLRLGSRCFLLERGQMLVSGRQNVCTRSMRVSVRGTNYIVELMENGDTAVTSLEGTVEVESLKDGKAGGEAPRIINSGQRLRQLLGNGRTTVIDLTPSDYRSILAGPLFRGFSARLTDQVALAEYLAKKVPGVSLPKQETSRSGSYRVNGQDEALVIDEVVCDIEKPFTLRTIGVTKLLYQMTPSASGRGTYSYKGSCDNCGDITFSGQGTYTISLQDAGTGTLTMSTTQGTVTSPSLGSHNDDTGVSTYSITPEACPNK